MSLLLNVAKSFSGQHLFLIEDTAMREFFRGWKRKVGCMLLALACAFTVAWLRSYYTIDLVFLNCLCPGVTFISGGGRCQFADGKLVRTLDKYDSSAKQVEERVIILERWDRVAGPLHRWSRPSLLGWPITKFEIRISSGTEETGVNLLPYWSVVVPLTAISAWLLLSKPKPSKPQTDPPV